MCPNALSQNGLIPVSTPILEQNGRQITYKEDFESKATTLAGQPYRVLAFAYAEIHAQEWPQWEARYQTPGQCLGDLVLTGRIQFNMIGLFALKDPIRSGVKKAVHFAREEAKMGVRLISGDHVETARRVAADVGIIAEEDAGSDSRYTVMDAAEFE